LPALVILPAVAESTVMFGLLKLGVFVILNRMFTSEAE